MRLFFAIPLPEALKGRLAEFQRRAKATSPAATWSDPRGFHLTLAFLGETEEARVPLLAEVARRCASSCRSFDLTTGALGGFPSEQHARVLWLGLEESLGLETLCMTLRKGLREYGCDFDEKPFKAHVTLARFKIPEDMGRWREALGPCTFRVQEMVLFQSLSSAVGVHYREIDAQRLG
jgi:2'-5' RNA ligase